MLRVSNFSKMPISAAFN